MNIRARVQNQEGAHRVTLTTDGTARTIEIPPKPSGLGSSASGGELLFLALATCYCNDLYREAERAGITVERVEVEVAGAFGGVGEPARNVTYRARVVARGSSEEEVRRLLEHTDEVAEVQNTLRAGVAVRMTDLEVEIRA
jgi:organic hydroperoxide reductase OsmC/OhrA